MAIKISPGTLQSKNVALTLTIAGQLYEVFARTSASNVLVDKTTGETLKTRLQALATKIAELESFNADTGDVDKKITDAVNAAISKIVDNADIAYDTLKEVSDFINAHKTEFASLSTLAENVDTALKALTERVTKNETDITALDTAVTANKDAIAALDTRVTTLETAVPATTEVGTVLTHTTDGNIWDKVVKTIDVDTVEGLAEALAAQIRVGQIGAVLLEDEPTSYAVDADGNSVEVKNTIDYLTAETPNGGTITLQESVVIPADKAVTFTGTVDLNGYTLEVAK